MHRRISVALIFLIVGVAATGAQEIIFVDDFEWGSSCGWSNDLWYLDLDVDTYGDELDAGIASDCPSPASRVDNNLDCDGVTDEGC